MKWIGQHIVDLIARFRGDVYLEDISTGTIASGAHLGLDSNNKIVKAVDGGGDLTSIVAGNDLGGTNLTGPIPTLNLNSTLYGVSAIHNESLVVGGGPETQVDFATEAKIKFKISNANQVEITDGAILPITNNDIDLGAGDPELFFKDLWLKGNANIAGNISGTWAGAVIPSAKLDADTAHLSVNNIFTGDNNTFSSATASKPLLELKNTHTTTSSSAEIKFVKDAVDTEDAERLGFISFYGENESNVQTKFVQIQAQIAESDAGAEGGKIGIAVATHDGEMQNGVLIVDGDAEDEVDVTIATGASSLTTIAGNLTVTSDLTVNGDTITFESANEDDPQVIIKNTTANNQGARFQMRKDRGAAMLDNDRIGEIDFIGENEDEESQQYAKILVQAVETADGAETGKINFQVSEYDGTLTSGLQIIGQDQDGEIDVTIGAGAASTTTIVGTLKMGSIASLTNAGLVVVANQSNITGVGTLSSGNATGIVTDASTSAKGIASFSSDDFVASAGAITIKDDAITTSQILNAQITVAKLHADAIQTSGESFTDNDTSLMTSASIEDKIQTTLPKKSLHYVHADLKDTGSDMTNEHFISLGDADRESTNVLGIAIPITMPANGVLKRVIKRSQSNFSGKAWSYKFRKAPSGTALGSAVLISTVTKSAGGAGNVNSIIDFTTDDSDAANACTFESGFNTTTQFSAGDSVVFSFQCTSASGPGSSPKIVWTLVFELDDTTAY